MKDEEGSLEAWLEGFTSSPYTGNQLNEIRARADNVSAGEVKHLVKEVELLRCLLRALLEYSEKFERELTSNIGENKNQLFDVVRFMLSARE